MIINPFVFILFITSLLMFVVFIRSWMIKGVRGAREFSLLALAGFIYSFFYAFELTATDLKSILIWIRFEYLGIVFIAPTILAFALKYTGRIRRFSLPLISALLVVPILTLVLVQTLHLHDLYYQNIYLDTSGSFPILTFERGIGYWLHVANLFLAVIVSNILFLQMWFNTNKIYRRQVTIIFIGSLIPIIGFILYLSRIWTVNIDITAFTMPLGALFFFYGLVRLNLFDLIPVARDRLFEALPDSVVVFDIKQRVLDYNSAAGKCLGLQEDSIGKPAEEVFDAWLKLAKAARADLKQSFSIEFNKKIAGEKHWFRAEFIPLNDNLNVLEGRMLILKDITERYLTEENLRLLATTDYLTGLWNRRFFSQSTAMELKRAIRYKRPFSIITMDLDHFKEINDTYGHSGGDRVLIALAALLKNRLRQVDIVARLGGEEFGILLPDTKIEEASILAEELRQNVETSIVWNDGEKISFTVSVGVAAYHEKIAAVDDLFKEADRALYKAKEKGRNCSVVSNSASEIF